MKTLYKFELQETDPIALFSCLHRKPYSLLFDSADRAHSLGRYSFIVFEPFETVEARGTRIIINNSNGRQTMDGNPFQVLKERLAGWGYKPDKDDPDLPPFQGGAAGFFGYDLARTLENLPTKLPAGDMPDMAIGLYDRLVSFDPGTNKAWFVTITESEAEARKQYDTFLAATVPAQQQYRIAGSEFDWEAADSRDGYETKVQKVIDYINAGDIFQANLSQRFSATLPDGFDPFGHYCHLRAVNPAPFAAYMNFGDLVLSSASPERLLSVKDRKAETRPIKGTRPRFTDPARDRAAKQELLKSGKDRAENIMIVDLLRNDLSKVCEDESVEVMQLCGLESFAGVHHLVSIINGSLQKDKHALDLLQACFPGGSITGAPKVRAMEIIEELETHRRGPYCGAMGYIGFDGTMDTNIAIRTLVYEGRTARFNTGGGIVADSDPAAEYEETLHKAGKLFASFTCGRKARKTA